MLAGGTAVLCSSTELAGFGLWVASVNGRHGSPEPCGAAAAVTETPSDLSAEVPTDSGAGPWVRRVRTSRWQRCSTLGPRGPPAEQLRRCRHL